MAVNIRRFYPIMVLSLIFTLAHAIGLRAQDGTQPKNVLHVRFDTLAIRQGDNDVFLNVYYTFTATKPHDLHGYNAHFYYDSTKVRIVEFFLQGTASEGFSYQQTNTKPPEAAVVTLGNSGQELDFKNPVLFTIRLSVSPALTDTTWLRWSYIDIPSYFGVDSLDLQDGWIRIKRQHKDISISTPRADVQADSLLHVPVMISDLTDANVRQGDLSFRYDTTVLSLVDGTQFPGSGAEITAIDNRSGSVKVSLAAATGTTYLPGAGELLSLNFKALHRTDTVCTRLMDGQFVAVNSDALLGSVSVAFDSICVYGVKPIEHGGVNEPTKSATGVAIYPNPVRDRLRIAGASDASVRRVDIYDALGRKMAGVVGSEEWVPGPEAVDGVYYAVITLSNGETITEHVVLDR